MNRKHSILIIFVKHLHEMFVCNMTEMICVVKLASSKVKDMYAILLGN